MEPTATQPVRFGLGNLNGGGMVYPIWRSLASSALMDGSQSNSEWLGCRLGRALLRDPTFPRVAQRLGLVKNSTQPTDYRRFLRVHLWESQVGLACSKCRMAGLLFRYSRSWKPSTSTPSCSGAH